MDVARYDSVAGSYASGPDDYSVPATRSLLTLSGAVDRLRVLDLACGHGLIAREMARRGGNVIGVDVSGGLLARANDIEASDPLGVAYVEADVRREDTLADEEFDVIVSNFGLSDIDGLDEVLATVRRLLTADGRFVFSILHPCFPGVANVSGSWPADGRYYDERFWRADGELSVLRRQVGANHRMLSTYMNALFTHGLLVERIEEPAPEDGWTKDRVGADRFPLYLVVRCVPA